MTEHKGLPVKGYAPTQSDDAVNLVNEGKQLEERVLRYIDKLNKRQTTRFASIGKTEIQLGFMMLYRAVFQPDEPRISLPEDDA